MISSEKVNLVGNFLDSIKSISKENNRLNDAGVQIGCFGTIEANLWDCIKLVVGMPEKEEIGVWVSDYWLEFSFKYDEGTISKEEAVNRIINWRSDFKDQE